MTGAQYAVVAFVVGLGLMLGYAMVLWLAHRNMARRRRNK